MTPACDAPESKYPHRSNIAKGYDLVEENTEDNRNVSSRMAQMERIRNWEAYAKLGLNLKSRLSESVTAAEDNANRRLIITSYLT
jgi:hypothetical protein